MLELLDPAGLRARLHLTTDAAGAPAVGSVATLVQGCVESWRSPARARVTAYLHRQLIAAGFDEEQVRDRVADVVDALIDIGDLTPVRLDGRACLVRSRGRCIAIGGAECAMVGNNALDDTAVLPDRYVRSAANVPVSVDPIDFVEWLGPAGFRRHLARRAEGHQAGAITEFWSTLVAAVHHDGNPLDRGSLRAVVDPPGSHSGFFGRHQLPAVSGRWRDTVPDGMWCGVRPGRNAQEWHPIIAHVAGTDVRALDLFDWDEWGWALLARGAAVGAPEQSKWQDGLLSFAHPVPAQFNRALRLLGGPGERAWTWLIGSAGVAAFEKWRSVEL